MATMEQVRGWFTEGDYKVPEELDKIIEGMIKAGYMVKKDGLFYITKKGHFELMYGKLKEWEPWHMNLRTCIDCGLVARNTEDLGKFENSSESKYGKRNLCKACRNKRTTTKRHIDDRVYLSRKFTYMKQRCYNPNSSDYQLYGAKGIMIHQEWLDDPDTFVDWAFASGWKRGLEIDRIDGEGNYSPDNCRWVIDEQQSRNRRKYIVTNFERGTRICEVCGIKKPLEDFHRDKSRAAGRVYVCKVCLAERYKSKKQQ